MANYVKICVNGELFGTCLEMLVNCPCLVERHGGWALFEATKSHQKGVRRAKKFAATQFGFFPELFVFLLAIPTI